MKTSLVSRCSASLLNIFIKSILVLCLALSYLDAYAQTCPKSASYVFREGDSLSEVLWNVGTEPVYGNNGWLRRTLTLNPKLEKRVNRNQGIKPGTVVKIPLIKCPLPQGWSVNNGQLIASSAVAEKPSQPSAKKDTITPVTSDTSQTATPAPRINLDDVKPTQVELLGNLGALNPLLKKSPDVAVPLAANRPSMEVVLPATPTPGSSSTPLAAASPPQVVATPLSTASPPQVVATPLPTAAPPQVVATPVPTAAPPQVVATPAPMASPPQVVATPTNKTVIKVQATPQPSVSPAPKFVAPPPLPPRFGPVAALTPKPMVVPPPRVVDTPTPTIQPTVAAVPKFLAPPPLPPRSMIAKTLENTAPTPPDAANLLPMPPTRTLAERISPLRGMNLNAQDSGQSQVNIPHASARATQQKTQSVQAKTVVTPSPQTAQPTQASQPAQPAKNQVTSTPKAPVPQAAPTVGPRVSRNLPNTGGAVRNTPGQGSIVVPQVNISEADLRKILNTQLIMKRFDDTRQRDYVLQVMLAPVSKSYQDKLPNLLNIAYDARVDGGKSERFALWGSYTRTEYSYTYTTSYIDDEIDAVGGLQTKTTAGIRSDLRMGGSLQHMFKAGKAQLGLTTRLGLALFSSNWDVDRGETVQTLSQIDGLAFLVNVGAARVPQNMKNGSLLELDADYFHGARVSGKSVNAGLGWRFPVVDKETSPPSANLIVDVFGRLQVGDFKGSHPFDGETDTITSYSAAMGVRVHLK